MQIITDTELQTWLRIPATPGENGQPGTVDPVLTQLADLANGVVSEAWGVEGTPTPAWVRTLTLEVAARAYRNPGGLESWTRSIDDGSRTERLPSGSARAGIYLTDTERALLTGGPGLEFTGSIQMRSDLC